MLKEFDMQLLDKLAKQYYNPTTSRKMKSEIITTYARLCNIKRETAKKRIFRYVNKSRFDKNLDKSNSIGRPPKYNQIHKDIIKYIWEFNDCICAERLFEMLKTSIDQLLNDKEDKFKYIFPLSDIEFVRDYTTFGSLKRIIQGFPKEKKKRYYYYNNRLYRQIPIEINYSKYSNISPGYIGLDFVEHKGENSYGLYAITATIVELYTQWINRVSSLGKDRNSVRFILDKFNQRNPFQRYSIIKGFHSDNEKSVLSYLLNIQKTNKNIIISRNRSNHSNDNCNVEQKNWDKVRKIVGYFRYDTDYEVDLLNKIWELSDLIDNFFVPSSKLVRKIRDKHYRVIKKEYDRPKTPYQRVLESDLPQELKNELTEIYKNLNLVELRRRQRELIEKLMRLREKKNSKIIVEELEVYA